MSDKPSSRPRRAMAVPAARSMHVVCRVSVHTTVAMPPLRVYAQIRSRMLAISRVKRSQPLPEAAGNRTVSWMTRATR